MTGFFFSFLTLINRMCLLLKWCACLLELNMFIYLWLLKLEYLHHGGLFFLFFFFLKINQNWNLYDKMNYFLSDQNTTHVEQVHKWTETTLVDKSQHPDLLANKLLISFAFSFSSAYSASVALQRIWTAARPNTTVSCGKHAWLIPPVISKIDTHIHL